MFIDNDKLEEYNEWFERLVDGVGPDLVVVIARAAVRLSQIKGCIKSKPTVSNFALPFLSDEQIAGKRILIVDDSVIFGSTMAEISEYLRSRGAITFHAAFAVAEDTFFPGPHAKLLVSSKYRLKRREIRVHHAALVGHVLASRFDFNLDFPCFSLVGHQFEPDAVGFMLKRAERSLFCQETAFSTDHPNIDTIRYSALHSCLPPKLATPGVVQREACKSRLTFLPGVGRVNLTAIVQYAIAEGTRFDEIIFDDEEINSCWKQLEFTVPRNDPYYETALFRLVSSFSSLFIGAHLVDKFHLSINDKFDFTDVELDADSIGMLLGASLQSSFCRIAERLKSNAIRPIESVTSDWTNSLDLGLDELHQEIAKSLDSSKVRICAEDSLLAVVGRIFLTLRKVTDSTSERIRNPTSRRLKTGLTIKDILSLVRRFWRPDVKFEGISFCLDHLVDKAIAVPKVITTGGYVTRAFYCGEDSHGLDPEQISLLIARLHDLLPTDISKKKLTPFELQKSLVVANRLKQIPGLKNRPYNFGYVVFHEKRLVDRHVSQGSIRVFDRTTEKRRGKLVNVLERTKAFDYTPFEEAFDEHDIRPFYESFKNTLRIMRRAECQTEHTLLLTTCCDPQSTFQALAFELDIWRDNYGGSSLGQAIFAWENHKRKGADATILSQLKEVLVACTEITKKVNVWNNFDNYRVALEKLISKEPEVNLWWRSEGCSKLIRRYPYEPLEKLKALCEQAVNLTQFVFRLFSESRYIIESVATATWNSEGSDCPPPKIRNLYFNAKSSAAASVYNDSLRYMRASRSINLTREIDRVDDFAAQMRSAKDCFEEICAQAEVIAPRRETSPPYSYSDGQSKLEVVNGATRERLFCFIMLAIVRDRSELSVLSDLIHDVEIGKTPLDSDRFVTFVSRYIEPLLQIAKRLSELPQLLDSKCFVLSCEDLYEVTNEDGQIQLQQRGNSLDRLMDLSKLHKEHEPSTPSVVVSPIAKQRFETSTNLSFQFKNTSEVSEVFSLNQITNQTTIKTERVIMGDNYSAGQAGAMGPNSHAHDNEFKQIWTQNQGSFDLVALAAAIGELRESLRNAASVEADICLGNLAQAKLAAEKKDGPTVMQHLKNAGKFGLDFAASVGSTVVAEAIKASMGIGG